MTEKNKDILNENSKERVDIYKNIFRFLFLSFIIIMIIYIVIKNFNSHITDKTYSKINNYDISLYKKNKDGDYVESCKSISLDKGVFSNEKRLYIFVTTKDCTNGESLYIYQENKYKKLMTYNTDNLAAHYNLAFFKVKDDQKLSNNYVFKRGYKDCFLDESKKTGIAEGSNGKLCHFKLKDNSEAYESTDCKEDFKLPGYFLFSESSKVCFVSLGGNNFKYID